MEPLIGLFVIFTFALVAIDLLAEPMAEVIGYLIRFLALCVWEGIVFACKAIHWLALWAAWGSIWVFAKARGGAALGFAFAAIFFDEWRRGPEDEEPPQRRREEHNDRREQARPKPPPAPRDPYADAMALLSLAPGFTQADLSRAFKRAMKTAHPDAGGSTQMAQAVNAARTLIAKRHGWR